MKKVLTIIFAMAVMFGVSAQSFEKDYTYGFWSNWSIGVAPMFTKHINDNWTFGQGMNVGADLRFQKQVGQHWNMRIIADVPGFLSSDTLAFDRYGKGMVGFAWVPKNHFYMFADGGLAIKDDPYNWALAADAGLGLKFNICEHSTIFGEAGLDLIADIKNDMATDNAFVKVGYMYNFGLTNVDKTILADRELINATYVQDTINKLNARIKDNEEYEKALIEKINILESHDSSLHVEIARLGRENDSLRNVLKSFNDNKTNYYALPFSVQFNNNSYSIKSSEMSKVKAVAGIMKSDTTVHYTVAGFCDYTGSQAYNQTLSEKRAEAVKKALMKYGVKEEQIKTTGHGKDMPFGDDKQAINRRVSFYRD